jgi:hypothetical protein
MFIYRCLAVTMNNVNLISLIPLFVGMNYRSNILVVWTLIALLGLPALHIQEGILGKAKEGGVLLHCLTLSKLPHFLFSFFSLSLSYLSMFHPFFFFFFFFFNLCHF